MTSIPQNLKPKTSISNLKKFLSKVKFIKQEQIKPSKLERTPIKDYFFDYSTESKGYFVKRESRTGKIIEVFPLMFPR